MFNTYLLNELFKVENYGTLLKSKSLSCFMFQDIKPCTYD